MARPRTFEEAEIRDRLLQQFWMHGYAGTSLPDLEAATGLTRKSLYNAFGDKRAMFLRALGDFRNQVVAKNLSPLAREHAGLSAIRTVLMGLVDLASQSVGRAGCMVCNTAREEIRSDPDVRDHIDGYLEKMEARFLTAIKRGQAQGEIKDKHAQDLARLCVGAVVSLSVLSKAEQPVEVLDSIARETLAALE